MISRGSTLVKGHFTHETECPWPLHLKHSHWWKRQSWSKFAASHYAWGTDGVCDCKMDVQSTWIPTRHLMEHVSLVTWTIFKNYLLEVGLTQNHRETMTLWMLTTVGLFYLYHSWGTHMHRNSLKQHLVEEPVPYEFTLHLRVCDHTTWFWRCVRTALGSHVFMVTALGSCVKWPWVSAP